jgi:sugar phosphate isomerase/epimerase
MKIGATTIALAGWAIDPRQPTASQEQRLEIIRQLITVYGLGAVELTLDLGILFPQVFPADFYGRVASLQRELGFTCSVHLPFTWIDLSSLNERIRLASLESVRSAIELCRPLQVESYVLHLWGGTTHQIATVLENPAQQQILLGALITQAGRSLEQICAWLEPQRLCVETLEAPAFDLALPLVMKYGVSICLDVGHLVWQRVDEIDFLERHAQSIGEVHLHDARREATGGWERVVDHLPLGEGQVDYPALLRKLRAIDFSGVVIIEVNDRGALEKSLERLAPLLRTNA